MTMDFSFKNELIKDYFNGDDSYIPISELIYAHEHPLLTSSFLVQLEVLINKVTVLIKKVNLQGPVITRFVNHTIKFGAQLPNVTTANAPMILAELRCIYKLSNDLLKQYGVN